MNAGPIHPRIKRLPAERLALAAKALLAQKGGNFVSSALPPTTGPVFSGCKVDKSAQTLTLGFNTSLLLSDTVVVRAYNKVENNSATEVQINGNPPHAHVLSFSFNRIAPH